MWRLFSLRQIRHYRRSTQRRATRKDKPHTATESSSLQFAFRPLAIAAAAALAFSTTLPARAQFFISSGANGSSPVNLFPINPAAPVLDFTGNTVSIGNGAPGSFSALTGALMRAGRLDIANGGSGTGTVDVSGPNALVELSGTGFQRLNVGAWGIGTMTVSGGGVVDATVNAAACTAPGAGCNVQVGNGAGSTATLTITGIGSELRSLRNFSVGHAAVFTVANGGFDFGTPGGTTNSFVNVLAGGSLRTERATVGNFTLDPGNLGTEKAFGTVLVDGPGSQWVAKYNSVDNQAAGITIGNNAGGDGNVAVTNGGKLLVDGTTGPAGQTPFINIGANGGKGALTVSGAGSTVDVTGFSGMIQAGGSGAGSSGSFAVLAGAKASAVFLNVGRGAGSTGSALLDGAGSQLTLSGNGNYASGGIGPAYGSVGFGGNGQATVSNGAVWQINDGGTNSSATGRGPGISVGSSGGTGTLAITGVGSRIEVISTSIAPAASAPDNGNPSSSVGSDSGSTGTLNISAGGKLVITGNALSTATNVRNTTLNIGGFSNTTPGGTGTATVTGPGSELRVEGVDAFIGVGINGNGTLNLNNQALLATTRMNIGRAASGVGALNVDNSFMEMSGQWTSDGTNAGFTVGSRGGNGSATITNNSLVTITNMGSSGTNISLGGTTPNPLGHGELTVSGGSKINMVSAPGLASMNVGYDGSGVLTITGNGSQIDVGSGNVHAGRLATGTGSISVESGAKLKANLFNIGGGSDTVAGGTATVTVKGAGSEIAAVGDLGQVIVGRGGGTGTLNITDQGTISGKNLTIGRAGTGTLLADNATINLSGDLLSGGTNFGAALVVGNRGGNGTATINNSTLTVANASPAGARVLVGGTASQPLGTGVLNLTGGTTVNVSAAAGLGEFTVGHDGNGTVNMSGPGTTVSVNNGGAVYVARQAGSTGLLNMSNGAALNAGFVGIGVGSAGLTNNTLGTPGGTATLRLNDSTINTSRFELGANGLLTGNNGVINAGANGPVVIAGTISPGNSPGRLRINCDVTMLLGSKLILEIEQNGANFDIDQLIIGNESKFDLTSLQIIFSFIGDTDPNAFAASEGGFDLDKFIRAGGADNMDAGGLSTLFGKGVNADTKIWNQAVNAQMFAFESSAYDVTRWVMGPGGEVRFEASAIPEPASIALVLLALGAMAMASRRRAARRAF